MESIHVRIMYRCLTVTGGNLPKVDNEIQYGFFDAIIKMTYEIEYERLIARTYDDAYAVIRNPSGDAAFYQSIAASTKGPLLEVGCGTGRILLKAAETGIECVGIDASKEMLAVLGEKDPPSNVTYLHDSMETFELGESRFSLITAPFRALQHLLDVPSQLAALTNIRRHLDCEGAFVFDVFDPDLASMAITQEPEVLGATFQHQGYVMQRFTSIVRDPTTQLMTLTFRFEGGPRELIGSTSIKLRWFYRYELEHLLHRAGFKELTFYRDFSRTSWRSGSEIVVVAK